MKYLNTLPNSFIVGEKDNDGNILEQYGFPKGGLTYLIKGNNIKFYLTEDYFYKNVVFSADAPFLINGIPVSVDNLPAALKNIFKVEQEQVDVDTEFNTESFNPIANAPVAIRFNDVDSTIDSLSGEVQTKADIEDIPTNVSELVNDAGYVTEESLSEDYATKVWVQEQGYVTDISGKQDVSGMTAYTTNDAFSTHTGNTDIHVTANDKQTWNNKSDFSGSYNDLTDKPTIPVVPTNVSAFNNDAGYVTQANIDAAVSGKADTSAVTASLAALDEKKLDASAYTPTDLSNYYTKDETSGATEIATALDGKADIEDIPTNVSELVNDEGYVTQNDIDAAVSGKVNTTDFNTYSAATDNRLSEDEEVTSAALNALNAVSGDVNTLSGQVATISGDIQTLSGSVESLHGAIGELEGDVSTHTANTDIHVTTSDKQNWNNKSDFSGDYNDLTNKPTIPTVPTNVSDFVNDAGYATSGYVDSSVSGKVNTTDFNTYSASTDARLSEDEEVTAAALNSLNSNKQDKLTAGENITINGNVISADGGNNVIELTQAEYDELTDIDPDAFYIITDAAGAVTTGQVQTMIDDSISGKADTSAVTEAVSGKMDTSVFNTYSASTDARLAEDEEVTSAALNSLNDALDDKADTTAVTASIAAAVSGKQDTLIAGTNITISGNVISAEGGSITVDSAFSRTSENPVQNKVISNAATNGDGAVSNSGGINKWTFYSVGGVSTNKGFYLDTINGKPVISQYNGIRNLNLVETSAITSSVTSASTDSQVPSAKAVYDALQEGGGGGGVPESAFTAYTASTEARLAEDEEVTAAGLNSLNDSLSDKADTSAVTESINAAVSGKADTSAFTAHTADTTIHTTSAEKASWNGAVTALGGLKLVSLTQAQYDALATKDASALYIIVN